MSGRTHPAFILICVCLWAGGLFVGNAFSQPMKRDVHTPEGQYQFAEGLYFRKFYDLAEKEFRYFVEKYPDHELAAQAMFRLINCLRNQNKTDATLSAINQFQAKWGEHELAPKLFLWKGEILFNKGEFEQASACFKRLLFSDDSLVQEAAVYFLGQCSVKLGKPDVAFRTYGEIAERPFDGKHLYRPYALFAVAAAYHSQGDWKQAAAAFKRLCTDDHVPAQVLEESLYRLAELHFSRSEFTDAIELYSRILREFPDGIFAREAGKRRAWAYFSTGDFTKGAEMAREWREKYADVFDYELDYIHGACLVGISFFEEALPIFVGLAGDSRVPGDYVRLARFQELVCLLNLKRYQETVAQGQAFVKEFPVSAELATVYYYMGEALSALQKYEEAVTNLRKAVDSFVGDWEYNMTASLLLADTLIKLEKYKEAAAVFRRLSENKDSDQAPVSLFRAGECERKAGDPDAAIEDLQLLLKTYPNAQNEVRLAMVHLGELYSEKGDYAHAETFVRNLLGRKDQEGKGRLRFFLGYLLYQQDRYQDAITELRQSLSMEGGADVADQARFYLAGSLLELNQADEALDIFAGLLSLPAERRPPFQPELLFQLDKLYFSRNRYDVSEAICKWLMEWKQGDVVYRAALRLAEILIAQNRFEDAEKQLKALLDQVTKGELIFAEEPPPREEIQSVLCEVLFLRGENDRAVELVESCLSSEVLDTHSTTRCRWVLGEILLKEGRPRQALPCFVKCFVLADDPDYTPKAMFRAVQVFVTIDQTDDALTTWEELKKRYPAYAGQQEGTETVKALQKARIAKKKAESAALAE